MSALLRIFVAFAPLMLSPLLVFLIGEGRLDLGGGEKDLVWILPWTLWSLVFAGTSLFLWFRGGTLGQATKRAALAGLGSILVAAAALALLGQLGVGGVV